MDQKSLSRHSLKQSHYYTFGVRYIITIFCLLFYNLNIFIITLFVRFSFTFLFYYSLLYYFFHCRIKCDRIGILYFFFPAVQFDSI